MPAVYPDLAAASASFSSTAAPVDLTYRRLSVEAGAFDTRFRAVYRLQDDEVTFVGGAVDDTFSVVMPSHQANDLLIVFAVNGSGSSTAPFPADSGWTTILFNGGNLPFRLAYKYAKTNTETVGVWIGATRTSVVIYRNARKFDGNPSFYNASNQNTIKYFCPTQSPSAGSRVVWFGSALGELEACDTPSGATTRVSSDAAGIPATSIGIHDLLIPAGQKSVSSRNVSLGGLTRTISVGVVVQYGKRDLTAEPLALNTTLNGDILENTLQLISRRYNVTLPQVFTRYRSFFDAGSASYSATAAPVSAGFGFYLEAESGTFASSVTDALLSRALKFLPATTNFPYGAAPTSYARGYFTLPAKGSFSSTFADVDPYYDAYIAGDSQAYSVVVDTVFKRSLILHLNVGLFNGSMSEVGIRNNTLSPAAGGPTRTPKTKQGGSDPSYPTFLRPAFVQHNSVSKSRDLGAVNNFYGSFSGEIGGETGTHTLFFKITTLGTADLRILKNNVNRYTDKQISVGILNSERKPCQLNDFGFSYANEIENTDLEEFSQPMPAGTYYFTVSSSLWQKIPYSVEVQAIRFSALEGLVTLSSQSYARFAIAKMIGPVLLTGPLVSTIPTNDQLKRPTGALLVTSGTRGALTTPEGVAICSMLPSGRLKMTHKIGGKASVTGANIATLSSAPPYGGGYGGP
jgi:hypothetical protein